MLFPRLDVQNDDLLLASWSRADLEVFAVLVPTDVENNRRRLLTRAAHAQAAERRLAFQNFHSRAHPGKVPIQITAHCFFLSKTASSTLLDDPSTTPFGTASMHSPQFRRTNVKSAAGIVHAHQISFFD